MATIVSFKDLRPNEDATLFTVDGLYGKVNHKVNLTADEAQALTNALQQRNRPHIQSMPEAARLSAEDREFFISGVTPEKWLEIYGEDEEDEFDSDAETLIEA